jgi:hypothetical protein
MDEICRSYSGDDAVVQGNPVGSMLALLRELAPDISADELRQQLLPGIGEAIEALERKLPQTHAEMRAAITDLKILSFSEIFDNILMWAHYAQNHSGAVFRFTCVEELDSAWGAATPVNYQSAMPRLLDERQMIRLLSGQAPMDTKHIFGSAVLTKATDWAYEREWRVIGGWNPRVEYEDIDFHEKEFTAIYLGCRIRPEDRDELIAVVREAYPHSLIFAGKKSDRSFGLEFSQVA